MNEIASQRRSVALLILLLLLTGGLVLSAPASGRAEGRPLEFSQDGVHWTSQPPAALFHDDVVLAPGGSATATLHLRSIAPSPGILEVSLTNVRVSAEEAGRAFRIGGSTDAGAATGGSDAGLPRTRVADLVEGMPVGPPRTLAPGQRIRVQVTVDLTPTPESTGAQSTALSLDLALSFRDAAARGDDDATRDDDDAKPPTDSSSPVLIIPALTPETEPSTAPGAVARPASPAAESSVPSAEHASAPSAKEAPAPSTEETSAFYQGPLAVTGFTRTVMALAAGVLILAGLLLLALGRRGKR